MQDAKARERNTGLGVKVLPPECRQSHKMGSPLFVDLWLFRKEQEVEMELKEWVGMPTSYIFSFIY
jgi:hypothetical protein